MRTTITLDDDVAAKVTRLRAHSSIGFKQLINDLLRAGLTQFAEAKPPKTPYRTPSTDAGRCLLGSVADIQHVLSEVEGPLRR